MTWFSLIPITSLLLCYLDAGTGSLILQVIIAGAVSLCVVFIGVLNWMCAWFMQNKPVTAESNIEVVDKQRNAA